MFDSEDRKEGWEKQTIEKLAFSSVNEQRRARRWGIFFKSLD
jgi:protease-4